jgi:hypothetical protein
MSQLDGEWQQPSASKPMDNCSTQLLRKPLLVLHRSKLTSRRSVIRYEVSGTLGIRENVGGIGASGDILEVFSTMTPSGFIPGDRDEKVAAML